MCGITGIIGPNCKELITFMTNAISHRGPDDFGYYHVSNLSLGHRRLSIQDLSSNGHQPMVTQDNRYCIIFNGEIYNHWDIRKTLESNYTFKSISDTETLLYGFVEYGVELFNKLNGIFAMAIYDNVTEDLIIVRDHFGVKPLYYYHDAGSFIFSSELKSINTVPFIDRSLDPKGLLNYVRFLWSPGERTPFKKIKKLLPAHYLKLNLNDFQNFEMIKYYTIPFNGNYLKKSEAEWIDALETQLFEAVKRQMLSDVPIGFFLSGGLDSSAIVAMAKRALPNQKLKCFTIDSGTASTEDFSDDLYFAKKVAHHLEVELIIVDGRINVLEDFNKMVYHLDEPQADVAPLHVLHIAQKAREYGCKVLLGGTGGDDVFSGYRRHQAIRFESIIQRMPFRVITSIKLIFKKFRSTHHIVRRIKKLLLEIEKNPIDRLTGYFCWISNKSAKKLLAQRFQDEIRDYDPQNILIDTLNYIPNEKDTLNKMLYLELKYFLADHNLNYTDKLSMAVGVEVRVPFLDKELVEFSTSIPPLLKLKGMTTKYLLKKVMERYLPNDVIYRSKVGFGAPIRSWIQADLKSTLEKDFSTENIVNENIFNSENVAQLFTDNSSNKFDASYTILSLMSIRSWISQFTKI